MDDYTHRNICDYNPYHQDVKNKHKKKVNKQTKKEKNLA